MEETPRSSTTPSTAVKAGSTRRGVEIGKAIFDQRQAAVRRLDQPLAKRERVRVAVDTDHLAIGGTKDRGAVAAGAEGGVDICPSVMNPEEFQRAAAEHGNVEG